MSTFVLMAYDGKRQYAGSRRLDVTWDKAAEEAACWSNTKGAAKWFVTVHQFDHDTQRWSKVCVFRAGSMTDRDVISSDMNERRVAVGQIWRSRANGSRFRVGWMGGAGDDARAHGSDPDGKKPRSIAARRLLLKGRHGYDLETE